MTKDQTVKIILLGNGSVGKSSIIQRLVDDGFQKMYKQTIGLDFFEKKMILRCDKIVLLEIWDIGGQNLNSMMLNNYIYGAQVIFLCYDITDYNSFLDLQDWYKLLTISSKTNENKKLKNIYLLGNKIDLIHLRKVSNLNHDHFIKTYQLDGGLFVSAKNGDNILRSFYKAAGKACNTELTEYELAFTDKAIVASIQMNDQSHEQRTAFADEIEAQDKALEEKKQKKLNQNPSTIINNCGCIII